MTVSQKRNRRALHTIRTLRMRQNKQAQKIDILCQDMVSAHEQFLLKLTRLAFATSFYESLLGCAGLEEMLDRAVLQIRAAIAQSGAAIVLIETGGFDVHIAKSADRQQVEQSHIHNWFTPDIVRQISHTNRICSLSDMLKMGLQASPSALKTLSAAAVPLGRLGLGVGFILIYRNAENPLLAEELSSIAAVTPGLREAIIRFKPIDTEIKACSTQRPGRSKS